MKPTYPNPKSQEGRLLQVLLDAEGAWINKQYFIRTMMFTQAGRAIHNLEKEHHWPIEHSDFTDEYGFKSYRLIAEPRTNPLFEYA